MEKDNNLMLLSIIARNTINYALQTKINLKEARYNFKKQSIDFSEGHDLDEIFDTLLHEITGIDFPCISMSHKEDIWSDFFGLKPDNAWLSYEKNLRKYLELTPEEIEQIFLSDIQIISHLVPPHAVSSRKNVKGLVYGNIQSGKTANMTGLISLYARLGCRLTIVFTGIHNKLWEQTSTRMRRDLNMDEEDNIGWTLVTGDSDHLDECGQKIRGILNKWGDNHAIILVKKNYVVLDKLYDFLITDSMLTLELYPEK